MPALGYKRAAALAAAALAALALGACGSTVSTSHFKGEEHAVAQAIADFQSHATASEQAKICEQDLAAGVVKKLEGKKGCEAAIKRQLNQVDNLDLTVESVKVAPDGKTATASVKSTYAGKQTTSTVALVKEGGKWRLAALSQP
jgi:copper chaperone CopZ